MTSSIRVATEPAVGHMDPGARLNDVTTPLAVNDTRKETTSRLRRRALWALVVGGSLAAGVHAGWQPAPVQAQSGCSDVATVSCSPTSYYGVGNYAPSQHCFDVDITNMFPSTPCSWSCVDRWTYVSVIASFFSTDSFEGFEDNDVVGTATVDLFDAVSMQNRSVTVDLLFREGIPGYQAPWVTGMVPVSGGMQSHVPLRVKIRAQEYPTHASYDFDDDFVAGAPDGAAIFSAYVSINCPTD